MPYTSLTVPAVGEPITEEFLQALADNEDYLNSQLGVTIGGSVVLNGSFESVTGGLPDSWTVAAGTGGTAAVDNTDRGSGLYSFKFTKAGGGTNSGGTITSADYFECSPKRGLVLQWLTKSSVAGVENIVKIKWYKADKTASATPTTTIFSNSSTNPTSWTTRTGGAIPPSDAYFGKLEFTGCGGGVTTNGSTWYDGVRFVVLKTALKCQVFDANGTFTVPYDCGGRIEAHLWGPGGGGSGGAAGSGGGGEYTVTSLSVEDGDFEIGEALAVVIGTIGTTVGTGTATTLKNAATTLLASAVQGATSSASGAGGSGGTCDISFPGNRGVTNVKGGSSPQGGEGGDAGTGAGQAPGGGGKNANGAIGRCIIKW